MRLLYIDIDTLRADHLGCYGYGRPTSPNIDALASEGLCFDNVYVSDAPCLPSRSALVTGRFGIRNGIVNHGGAAADLFAEGAGRGRQSEMARTAWPALLRAAGLSTTTISTFGERHSAFHWYAGFNEVVNLGSSGSETADQVATVALDWLRRRAAGDDWFLHVHFWDPHTPYRTPAAFGNPFADVEVPGWLTEEVRARHWALPGPHSAQEVAGFVPTIGRVYPRQPRQIDSAGAVRAMFDGYDTGIRYADHHVGRLVSALADLGVLDETAIMVSSDHGETLGELGIYCDHQSADYQTQRVPLVLRWPGLAAGGRDTSLRYQIDVAATVVQLLGGEVPGTWDGAAFASELEAGRRAGRDHLVLSCGAWTVQRSARFDDWLCIETYHDAYHGFPEVMLFDVIADPHQTVDRAPGRPDVGPGLDRLSPRGAMTRWLDRRQESTRCRRCSPRAGAGTCGDSSRTTRNGCAARDGPSGRSNSTRTAPLSIGTDQPVPGRYHAPQLV